MKIWKEKFLTKFKLKLVEEFKRKYEFIFYKIVILFMIILKNNLNITLYNKNTVDIVKKR